jgi:hypothetical protein
MVKDYNTGRQPIRLKEYGRNVQKLVEYIKTLEDKEERSKYIHTLIGLMKQILPGSKDVQENPQKFWDDMFIVSDFDLDIDSPYPMPAKEILNRKPERLTYHNYKVRYKHYGHNLELLVDEAIKMEDLENQQNAIIYIGKLMKTFHMTWNNELVDDEIILKIITELSGNKLKLNIDPETIKENKLFDALYKEKPKSKPRRNQGKGNQGKGNHNRRRR